MPYFFTDAMAMKAALFVNVQSNAFLLMAFILLTTSHGCPFYIIVNYYGFDSLSIHLIAFEYILVAYPIPVSLTIECFINIHVP